MFGRFLVSGRSSAPLLLNLDFSGFTLGGMAAASFLSATGLTFVRSTASTVQISASTLDETPGVDYACIGNLNGTIKGLVIQQNTRNGLSGTTSPRNLGNAWSGGTQSITYPFADSPDTTVTGCSRTAGASGTYSNFGVAASNTRRYFSSWQRSFNVLSNGDMQMGWIANNPGDGLQAVRLANNTWARIGIANGVFASQYFTVCDARDYSGSGGQTARARDVLVDYIQYELGDFPTEAIPTALAYRKNDRISYTTGSNLIQNSRVKFNTTFYPKHASTMDVYYDASSSFSGASAAWYLWSFNGTGTDFARIDASTKRLSVKLANGTTVTSTNSVSWSQYDLVEIDMEVGNNIASVARYRVNGGGWTDLVLATVAGAAVPAGAFTFFASDIAGVDNIDSGHLPCWLSSIKMYGT